jgi:replicative DNA helicase
MNTRMNEIQQWNEQDVLGAMLVNGNMTDALLKDLHAQDFRFSEHRTIYQAMKNLQHYGKFEATDLLTDDDIDNVSLISMMDFCLMTNVEVKCQWLLEQSHKLHT